MLHQLNELIQESERARDEAEAERGKIEEKARRNRELVATNTETDARESEFYSKVGIMQCDDWIMAAPPQWGLLRAISAGN